jgi:diacylglycerol O-acyltransferase
MVRREEGTTVMDRLEPLDALFVEAEDEDANTSMAIASIAVLEGPAPSQQEVLALVAARLPLVPRYRHKLRTVPFRLGRPVWVDDPDFDLSYHIRRTALPAPGEDEQLAALMARVMSGRLDRDHPLWEYWVVEGLARDRWALISKVHHCMVDGVGGADLYRLLTELPTQDPPPATDTEAEPAQPPSAVSLVRGAAVDMAQLPGRYALALGNAIGEPGRTVKGVVGAWRALARFSPSVRPAAGSSLSGNIGKQRRYTWARASLQDIKTIKGEFGGTVNDVVLAVISGGFRALLLERGEEPQQHEVPSLVPVSVRALGDEASLGNQVSATVADLPVHIPDPVERLTAVRTELDSLKASNEAVIGQALATLGRYSLYPVASWMVRLAFWLPQHEIVTVTTNVPGPREPLYWMGRRLEEIIPYVPIASTVRIGISIFSYGDNVTFGLTGDYAANPDLDVLARGIERGVSELLLAAEQHKVPAAADEGAPPPARKPAARKPPVAKETAVKETAVKDPAGRETAGKETAGKGTTRKETTREETARKAAPRKATSRKPAASKATAGKATAGKATAGKATVRPTRAPTQPRRPG